MNVVTPSGVVTTPALRNIARYAVVAMDGTDA